MNCPKCNKKLKVYRTINNKDGTRVKRERYCPRCGYQCDTHEDRPITSHLQAAS
jgi:transcriptional regulator NrdR family protein